jgi:hypothetical protein
MPIKIKWSCHRTDEKNNSFKTRKGSVYDGGGVLTYNWKKRKQVLLQMHLLKNDGFSIMLLLYYYKTQI